MFEFDMHDAEFLAPAAVEDERCEPVWSPTMELYAELGLLTVAQSQAERPVRDELEVSLRQPPPRNQRQPGTPVLRPRQTGDGHAKWMPSVLALDRVEDEITSADHAPHGQEPMLEVRGDPGDFGERSTRGFLDNPEISVQAVHEDHGLDNGRFGAGHIGPGNGQAFNRLVKIGLAGDLVGHQIQCTPMIQARLGQDRVGAKAISLHPGVQGAGAHDFGGDRPVRDRMAHHGNRGESGAINHISQ